MFLQITSASWNILSAEKFSRIVLMTESGEITVLPGHEPILSAIRPGIMLVEYYVGTKVHTEEYAIGGWVLNITPEICTIVADVVANADALNDIEYIEWQRKEAERLVKEHRAENGEIIDAKKLIEIEYELLKYTAMHQLSQKHHMTHGGRK